MNKISKTALFLGCFLLIYGIPTFAFASDVFTQSEKFLTDVQKTFLTVSTSAAVIGVGTGAAFKTFSFGDPNKVSTGGKVIWGSVAGWTVLNGVPLILNTIQRYI